MAIPDVAMTPAEALAWIDAFREATLVRPKTKDIRAAFEQYLLTKRNFAEMQHGLVRLKSYDEITADFAGMLSACATFNWIKQDHPELAAMMKLRGRDELSWPKAEVFGGGN